MKCENCKHYVWSWEPPCALCVFTPKKGYCKRYVPKVENAVEHLRALDEEKCTCPNYPEETDLMCGKHPHFISLRQ